MSQEIEHNDAADPFWSTVSGLSFDADLDDVTITSVAANPDVQRAVSWLRTDDKAAAEDARYLLVQWTAQELGITPEQCEQAFRVCEQALEEENHGQA